MAKLVFFPDASRNFDSKAADLLQALSPVKINPGTGARFEPDTFVIEVDGVRERTESITVGNQEVCRFFRDAAQDPIGLGGEAHQKFLKLCEGICRLPTAKDKLSQAFVRDILFEWLKARYGIKTLSPAEIKQATEEQMAPKPSTEEPATGEPSSEDPDTSSIWRPASFTETLILQAEKHVKLFTVWCPIAQTFIEKPIFVGQIELRPLTEEAMDSFLSIVQEQDASYVAFSEQLKRRCQGLAAGYLEIEAEKRRAREICRERTSDACELLRFFSLAMLDPALVCQCVPLGLENLGLAFSITVESDRFETGEYLLNGDERFILDAEFVDGIQPGLRALNELIALPKRSNFQEVLLKSIRLYSNSGLRRDVQDKLLYVLTAIESLLLRDKGDHIQTSVGERMAFSRKTSGEDRKNLVQLVKKVYELRSDFFHHGQTIDDLTKVKEFLFEEWMMLSSLLEMSDKWSSKDDFLNAIEKVKYE